MLVSSVLEPRALLGRLVARSGIRIWTYHGVVDEVRDPVLERNFHPLAVFREQVQSLRRFSILSLEDVLEIVTHNRPLKKNGVVVTMDNGYVNNFKAAEVLQEAGVPWTVFVPSESVSTKGTVWTCELSLLL